MSSSNPSPQGSGSYSEKAVERVEEPEVTPRKRCLPDTTEVLQIKTHRDYGNMHKAFTGPSQTGFQHRAGDADIGCYPNHKAVVADAKKKVVFSHGVSLCISTTLQVALMPKCSESTQNELNSIL